jgi:hypothetical protein
MKGPYFPDNIFDIHRSDFRKALTELAIAKILFLAALGALLWQFSVGIRVFYLAGAIVYLSLEVWSSKLRWRRAQLEIEDLHSARLEEVELQRLQEETEEPKGKQQTENLKKVDQQLLLHSPKDAT